MTKTSRRPSVAPSCSCLKVSFREVGDILDNVCGRTTGGRKREDADASARSQHDRSAKIAPSRNVFGPQIWWACSSSEDAHKNKRPTLETSVCSPYTKIHDKRNYDMNLICMRVFKFTHFEKYRSIYARTNTCLISLFFFKPILVLACTRVLTDTKYRYP